MDHSVIPVHRPAKDRSEAVWTEKIIDRGTPVRNSVHRHSYHEIFLFTKGEGRHMIDLEVVAFEAPCIHLVAPGQVHQLDRSQGSEGAVIMFSEHLHGLDLTEAKIRSILRGDMPRNIPLTSEASIEAMGLFERIETEHLTNADTASAIKEHYLGILLLKCIAWSRNIDRSPVDRQRQLVDRFIEMVDREFLEKKQIAGYASAISISAGHLNELVKKRTGKSASEILHDRILLEAKRLLLHSSLSVKEVSFSLRMEDPAYFTRMFRKATGTTPLEYRKHIREKYQG